MQLTTIEAKTLPEAWFLCIDYLIRDTEPPYGTFQLPYKGVHTYTIDKGSFEGHQRLEFDHVTIHVEYPGSRPLVPDVPQGVPAPTTLEYVDRYYHRYIIGTEREEGENYTYGEDISSQIPKVMEMLLDGPNTNQACITLGDRYSITLPDPQCLKVLDFRVLNNRLSVITYFRSWDLWAGFPSNLAAIQLLKEQLAKGLHLEDGELIASSKGLHLYNYSWNLAKQVLRR